MTERRPHWDQELEQAVSAVLFDCYENGISEEQVYQVIAAVEDWHKAKRDSRDRTHSAECWRWHQECAEHLIERQRSTIQRVRDVCDLWQRRHDSSIRHPADIPAVAIVAVLRALDGDGDA